MESAFKVRLAELCARVDAALEVELPGVDEEPGVIHEAMRYSVFAGGKRLRPALCIMVARAEAHHRAEDPDAAEAAAMPSACALEMVHTYSLIHDDLPCMDDDDLRRGKPTCHVAFGEAMAVLAGDALNTSAFEVCARTSARAGELVTLLANCAGTRGMVGGQVDDLRAVDLEPDADLLASIHLRKTAKLFVAASGMGAICGGAGQERLAQWKELGREVGIAFQIVDDILDVTASSEDMGKRTGKDEAAGKLTYPGLHGLPASRECAEGLLEDAARRLAALGDQEGDLGEAIQYLRSRSH